MWRENFNIVFATNILLCKVNITMSIVVTPALKKATLFLMLVSKTTWIEDSLYKTIMFVWFNFYVVSYYEVKYNEVK